MNTKQVFHSFTNHRGLAAVFDWDKRLHGHKRFCKRSQFCLASALAIVNGTTMPPIPFEGTGKTKKPWRAAHDRIETIRQIINSNK